MNEREKLYSRNGYASKELKRLRTERKWINEEACEKNKEEGSERIKESRYNRNYDKGTFMTEKIPLYLERKNSKGKKIMPRFRCGRKRDQIGILDGKGRESV